MKTTLKEYIDDPKNKSTVDVGLFIILILSFHFLYLGWQALEYWPIKGAIDKLSLWSVNRVYRESCWVLQNLLRIDITTESNLRLIAALSKEGTFVNVVIAPLCASLKQWLHWLFLMLIFPGPWKHKAWYIPLGLVIIEFTNVVRVVGISLFLRPYPHDFALAHDGIFKIMFYVVIFLMWALWNDHFHHTIPQKSPSK